MVKKKNRRPRSNTNDFEFNTSGYDGLLPHERSLYTHGRAPVEERTSVDWQVSMVTDPRKSQEILDSRMIQEDRNAIANLPETPIHREFKPWTYPHRNYEDDGISR